jgi:hypothetical protein
MGALGSTVIAAEPWTYWLAVPLLVADILFLVGFAILYGRRMGYLSDRVEELERWQADMRSPLPDRRI